MQAVAQIMRQWCGIAALVLSPTLAWAACPALPSAVVPYTVFGGNGAAAVTTQATTTADATVQGAVAFDTAAGALKVCGGTSWQTLGAATPAGSSGYVQFSNGSAFDAESALTWSTTGKFVAVNGTYYGSSQLIAGFKVQGSGNDFGGMTVWDRDGDFGTSDDGDATIYWGDNASENLRFAFAPSGTGPLSEKMRLTSSGYLGIGTISPTNALDVVGSIKATGNINQNGPDLNIYNSNRCKSDGVSGTDPAGYCDNLGRAIVHLAGDNINLNYSNDFDGGVVIGTLNKFLPDGSLGIGTTSPGMRLTIVHSTDTWDGIAISETGVSNESFAIRHYGGPGSGTQIVQDGNLPLRFVTNNVERMRVDGSGWVGIATGSGVSPAATLDVNGYMKLKKNTAAPVTCGGTYDGAIALTSARRMCVCDGTSWTEVNSATACTW